MNNFEDRGEYGKFYRWSPTNIWKKKYGPSTCFQKLPMGSTLWEPRSWGQSIRFAICIILLYTMRMLSYLLGIWNRINISQNTFFTWYYSLPQKIVHTPFFPFALKTIESGLVDIKDIVYITLLKFNLIVIDLMLCRIEAELLT